MKPSNTTVSVINTALVYKAIIAEFKDIPSHFVVIEHASFKVDGKNIVNLESIMGGQLESIMGENFGTGIPKAFLKLDRFRPTPNL